MSRASIAALIAGRGGRAPSPALPPALAPWAALFSDVPEPEGRLVAALVEALRPLVEGADGSGARPRGEIDGLAGLGFRGGIERLIASEWLWRDLAPDEFLRRALERELLTHEPSYRQAAEASALLVVLDAGPETIGAARLVAFAALLCLGALAHRRGERLLWASNAAPQRGWCEGVEPADAMLLLRETAATGLDGAEVARLLARPPAAALRGGTPAAGLWLVGGPGLTAEPSEAFPAAHRVAIAERARLDANGFALAARVTVADLRGGTRSATLDLPDGPEATALLRDPFRPRRGPGEAGKGAGKGAGTRADWAPSGLAFTPSGEHLLIALRDGVLVVPTGYGPAHRLRLARYERLAGLHVAAGILWVALVQAYTDRARLIVRQHPLAGAGARAHPRLDLRVAADHPLAQARFPAPALPPFGPLKRHRRHWLLAPDGSPFLAGTEGVSAYSALRSGTPVVVCPAALLVRRPSGEIVAHDRRDGAVLARFPVPEAPGRVRAMDLLRVSGLHEPGYPVLVRAWNDGSWSLDAAPSHGKRPAHRRLAADPDRVGVLPPGSDSLAGLLSVLRHAGGGAAGFVVVDGGGNDLLRVELPDPTLDVVRLAAHPQAGCCAVAARLDADGFVTAFALRALPDGPPREAVARHVPDRDVPDVAALAEATPCLP